MSRLLRAASAALLIPAIVLTVGCQKPSIVGKWKGTVDARGRATEATTEFSKDEKLTISVTAPVALTMTGTYKVTGSNFEMHLTDMNAMGRSMKIPASQNALMNRTGTWKVEGDSLSLIAGGKTEQFTRVKE